MLWNQVTQFTLSWVVSATAANAFKRLQKQEAYWYCWWHSDLSAFISCHTTLQSVSQLPRLYWDVCLLSHILYGQKILCSYAGLSITLYECLSFFSYAWWPSWSLPYCHHFSQPWSLASVCSGNRFPPLKLTCIAHIKSAVGAVLVSSTVTHYSCCPACWELSDLLPAPSSVFACQPVHCYPENRTMHVWLKVHAVLYSL